MSTSQLITIQCGNYANYIGSHFWNIQEAAFEYDNKKKTESSVGNLLEVDNDILYREGLTLDRHVTYTPRLVAIDLKGCLGSLPELGELYGKPVVPKPSSLNWTGETEVLKSEPYQKNPFLKDLAQSDPELIQRPDDDEKDCDESGECGRKVSEASRGDDDKKVLYNLDNCVTTWSDYLVSRFHPKSVLLVESYQANDELHPFDTFGRGKNIAPNSHQDLSEEIEDRLRYFAEECESLQGFQLITDSHNAFGGISSALAQLLSDEYSAKCVLSFPVSAPTVSQYNFDKCGTHMVNQCLTLSALTANSPSKTVTVPLSLANDWFPLKDRWRRFPNLNYRAELNYHSGAVLGAILDTATLTYRQRPSGRLFQSPMRLYDMIAGLSVSSTNMAAVSAGLPFNMAGGRDTWEADLTSQLTPLLPSITNDGSMSADCTTSADRHFTTLLSVRGALKSIVYKNRSEKYMSASSPEEYLDVAFRNQVPRCRSSYTVMTAKPLPTGEPYPHIFAKKVDEFGSVGNEDRSANTGVKFSSVLAAIDNGAAIGNSMRSLGNSCSKVQIGKLVQFLETGTELDEWREAVENIHQLADLYQ